jgi:exonuclease-1
MLLHFGVKPYLIFDGDYLPSKEHTEKERAARRKESKREGLELLRMKRPSQAYLELQKAVDVTPSMARELIEELKVLNVPYVVAPYEADSQLAYLERQGTISGVLSEDSDLLVFGVKCLLTKLDQYGECIMVNRNDFTACRDVSLVGWSDKEFRMMAILSGCDYLPGIDKMGLKTAYRLVRKHKVLERVIRSVQFDGKMKVPPKYLDAFDQAEKTFLYQWVYCPDARRLVNLNHLPPSLDVRTMPYIGKHVEPESAVGVALGNLDPNTKEAIVFNKHPRPAYTRQSIAQTPDDKQGKPITEFFKAKRTPLAELDPNSFTPSPSQLRLLEDQRSVLWSASHARTARSSTLDRVAATARRTSAPQATFRALNQQASQDQRASPKRRRLCSDSLLADSMGGVAGLDSAASKFFSKRTSFASPSLRKPSRKDDFELWSDDPAAQAVAELTANSTNTDVKLTPSPKKRKKLKVYDDSAVDSQQTSLEDASQDTLTTTVSGDSQMLPIETPATSFEADETTGGSTVFTQGVNANFAALKYKFAFTSGPDDSKVSRQAPIQRPNRNPLRSLESTNVGRLASHTYNPDNLDGKRRPDHETVADSEVLASEVIPASSPTAPQQSTLEQDADTISDEEWLAAEQQEATALAYQGSEDLLIPNSPESAGGEDRPTGLRVDFGRFVFAG